MSYDLSGIGNDLQRGYMMSEANQLFGKKKWAPFGYYGLDLLANYVQNKFETNTSAGTSTTISNDGSSGISSNSIGNNWNPLLSAVDNFNNNISNQTDSASLILFKLNLDKSINSTDPLELSFAKHNALYQNDLRLLPTQQSQSGLLTGLQNGFSTGTGMLAGMGASKGFNALGNTMFGNSSGGQFATGVMSNVGSKVTSNVASNVAGNLVKGKNLFSGVGKGLSSLGSNASLMNFGTGAGNLALDTFHKVKKAKWENGANMAFAIGSMINPWVGVAGLAFNGIGHLTALKTRSFTANNDLLSNVGSSYNGSTNHILDAQSLANLRYSGWNAHGLSKDNKKIGRADTEQNWLDVINGVQGDRRDASYATASTLNLGKEIALDGDIDQRLITSQRKGGKIEFNTFEELIEEEPCKLEFFSVEEPCELEFFSEPEIIPEIDSYKEGGLFNVIPEGALHARKHHLDMDNITKKGIPVISESNGLIEQHAEIEKEEIILRLSVTEEIEKLAKTEGTLKDKDEAAIKAGKLLVLEILYNTLDNTNKLL